MVFKKQSDGVTYLLLTLMAFLFAGAFHAGKAGVAVAQPAALVFTRFLVATLFMVPFIAFRPAKGSAPRKADLPLLFFLGLTGIFLYHYLFFKALVTTSAVNASVLAALGPLLTSVLAALWGKERFGMARLGALLLALSGVLLALCNGDWNVLVGVRFNVGDLYMLGAVFFLSLYHIGSKRALERFAPASALFWSMAASLVVSLPLFLLERPWLTLPVRSAVFWSSVFYMAICASAVGFLFLQIGIRNVGVNRSVPFINLTSVFAMLIAVVLHGRGSVTWVQVVSACAVISGVLINSRIK